MIRSFRNKALEAFTAEADGSKLPVQNHARLERMLGVLNGASVPEDMALPGYRFHPLQGKPKRYSATVSGNYRLTWCWEDGHAVDVDIEDYH